MFSVARLRTFRGKSKFRAYLQNKTRSFQMWCASRNGRKA